MVYSGSLYDASEILQYSKSNIDWTIHSFDLIGIMDEHGFFHK